LGKGSKILAMGMTDGEAVVRISLKVVEIHEYHRTHIFFLLAVYSNAGSEDLIGRPTGYIDLRG
jgi:hypothetical protein